MRNRIKELESDHEILRLQNKELRKQLDKGVSEVKSGISSVEEIKKQQKEVLEAQKEESKSIKESVKVLQREQNQWKREQEEEKESFKEIIKSQQKEMTQTVVKVIKKNENLIRDTVDRKKCVMVFGLKEEKQPFWQEREKQEKKTAERIIREVEDEEKRFEDEIEEVTRIGRYVEGGSRPLRVKFQSQAAAEEVLVRAQKLARKEEFKKVWIKRDHSAEEREKIRELWNEADGKNESRTESEKKKFRWKVVDMRLRKWYIRGE